MALCVIMTLKDINLGVKFLYLFLMFSFVFSPGPSQNDKNGPNLMKFFFNDDFFLHWHEPRGSLN